MQETSTKSESESKAKGAFDRFKEGWTLAVACYRAKDKPHTVDAQAVVIAKHFNRAAFLRGERELAFVGIDTMADMLNVDRRTVIRNNAWLEAHGFLRIRRRRAGKRNLANLYTPILRKLATTKVRAPAGASQCYTLARELYDERGASIVGQAFADGAADTDVMDHLEESRELGAPVEEFAASIWTLTKT
jgi:hypothetical protein